MVGVPVKATLLFVVLNETVGVLIFSSDVIVSVIVSPAFARL